MSWGAHSEEQPGPARLALETARDTFVSEAMAAGYLLIDLMAPRPVVRGRLGLFIEGAIERALEARGAPPSARAMSNDSQASLGDQLERARVTGAPGLALWFASMDALGSSGGILGAEDSATVRWWIAAAAQYPVLLGFDERNQRLGVQVEPVTLATLLSARASEMPLDGTEPPGVEAESDPVGCELETAPDSDEPEDDRASDVGESRTAAVSDADPASRLADSARAMAAELDGDSETSWLREALIELSTPPPPITREDETSPLQSVVLEDIDAARPEPVVPKMQRFDLRFVEETDAPAPPAPPAPPAELDAETRRKLESCARELHAASGPKPLAVVERLFAASYLPLRGALDRGAGIPRLGEIADEWSRSFEKSYTEGFDALRMRAKRPTMVVDVPDIALRVARLHGARATQLLLVDAMRLNLGNAVNDRLAARVGKRAACAERFLLWAALPTNTGTQVELIGRGAAGLREMCDGVSEDLVVARGRKASMVRRLKTGHREVLKLDVVAARLTEPNGADPSSFDSLADDVADRIAAHFEGLQPRTLVMVFGDHGFTIDRSEGRATIREGGGSPEEVLVPAFAWLVGAVH